MQEKRNARHRRDCRRKEDLEGLQVLEKSCRASQVALAVKNLPDNAGDIEAWVRHLGWEDPLEKEMATYSSILAWRIPWREKPGGLQSMGLQRVGHD